MPGSWGGNFWRGLFAAMLRAYGEEFIYQVVSAIYRERERRNPEAPQGVLMVVGEVGPGSPVCAWPCVECAFWGAFEGCRL